MAPALSVSRGVYVERGCMAGFETSPSAFRVDALGALLGPVGYTQYDPPPPGSKYAALIHSSWLGMTNPVDSALVAPEVLSERRSYIPCSLSRESRTVYVTTSKPCSVDSVRERTSPFVRELTKLAARGKLANPIGLFAHSG